MTLLALGQDKTRQMSYDLHRKRENRTGLDSRRDCVGLE